MATGIDLKARWRRGEVSLGLFIHSTDPAIANVLAVFGVLAVAWIGLLAVTVVIEAMVETAPLGVVAKTS